MSEIAHNLTRHLVLIVVYRRERGFAIANFLKALKLEVLITSTLYDGLKTCAQEMPHLIISENVLSDGNAVSLYDRLNAHGNLSKIPILVFGKKTNQNIEALKERQFAGVFLGPPNVSELKSRIFEILSTFSRVSPYYIASEGLPPRFNQDFSLSVPARILGRSDDQLVIESVMEVDTHARLVCQPDDSKLMPLSFGLAHNVAQGDLWYNLFPIHRVQGKGRQWIDQLPDLGSAQSGKPILFCDSDRARFLQFKKALEGYSLDIVHANDLNGAAAMSANAGQEFSAIFISQENLANPANKLKPEYEKYRMPPLIVAKENVARVSTGRVRFVKQPFGLGTLVDMLRSSLTSAAILKRNIERSGINGVSIKMRAPARLLGLDETGGVFEVGFPIGSGSSVEVESDPLKELWGGQKAVTIENYACVAENFWQLHFRALPKGNSKSIYFSKLRSRLQP